MGIDADASRAADPDGESSSGAHPQTRGEDAETAALRQRYGSHMDLVRLIIQAWRAYALLYAEWMQEWPSEVGESVKQRRGLSFLHCAINFSEAMKAVSYRKHKSWYVFLTVWVAPRQIAERGDLWPYSTGPIEQRGARMEKSPERACPAAARPQNVRTVRRLEAM